MSFSGIQIVPSSLCATRRWIFPYHRFVEYEESDEWWARKYGFGHEGPEEPCMWLVGRILYVHPSIMDKVIAKLKKESMP